MTKPIPLALENSPALIEAVFPAQKVSFEAQRERKAGSGQTLTALGSYWKGRKPLILVRAIVLGSLLPQTDDIERDLEIFERLMAFDDEGLARRALANNNPSPAEIAALIELGNPWDFFNHNVKDDAPRAAEIAEWTFPLDCDEQGIRIRWRPDAPEQGKVALYRQALETFPNYEARAALCKRPEEVDPVWLYEPVWPAVNRHYAHLGIEAYSHQELVEQLGILRYGHRPKVGDTFCGGGSIPFEAARLGCDVYASDLNPIACMLTWGALNIIGASPERRAEIADQQESLVQRLQAEIDVLGVEKDGQGWQAKVFLYCFEVTCPETGWRVPLLSSLVVSTVDRVIVELIPDSANKRYDMKILSGVSDHELSNAETGTIGRNSTNSEAYLIHQVEGRIYRTRMSSLRGDIRIKVDPIVNTTINEK